MAMGPDLQSTNRLVLCHQGYLLRAINYMCLISVYCEVSFFFFFEYGSSSHSISYLFYLRSYKECPPDRASLGVSLIVKQEADSGPKELAVPWEDKLEKKRLASS